MSASIRATFSCIQNFLNRKKWSRFGAVFSPFWGLEKSRFYQGLVWTQYGNYDPRSDFTTTPIELFSSNNRPIYSALVIYSIASETLSSEFIRKSRSILQNPNSGHNLSSEISRLSCLKIERN